MERAKRRGVPEIVNAGDAAILMRLGNRPGPTASRRVLALVAALDASPPPGLMDVVPAYASVLICFDPLIIEPPGMRACLQSLLDRISDSLWPRGRLIRIPVYYGGDDGPDLEDVAALLELTTQELIERHTSSTYRVAFLGFLAGFPYLTGLPRTLAVPRLATPRTHVRAGSVAIADRQAGIYPVDSPGGWRILGRTAAPLFDPTRKPPSLLHPGDRVRFYPASANDRQTFNATPSPKRETSLRSVPWLRVIDPGIQATVQDHGRTGFARYGVSTSGAADSYALALGNALLANRPEAAALEITGGDVRFEALASSVIAVTGAPSIVRVNQRRVPANTSFALAPGDVIELGTVSVGMRVYLSVAEGVVVPRVLHSRATDLRAHLGGMDGRPLHAGDMLGRGPLGFDVAGRTLGNDLTYTLPRGGEWLLRVLPGPHAAQWLETLGGLLTLSFTVDARSDRVGVRLRRLDGPCLDGGQILSEGLPRGAVQVPPDGEPVLLLADAQTTGGYPVPAVVISADLWRIGQLRPGDTIRFHAVSPGEAVAALRWRAWEIERVARQPSPEHLLGGFAEWSDEADPMMPQREDGDDNGE
jgi:KipI family sensor histidine kinase inhibitor